MRLIRGIWRLSRAIAIGEGDIADLGEATLYIFLCIIFLIVGAVLLLLGVDFDAADRWLDGMIEPTVTFAIKAVEAFVLLICLILLGMVIYDKGQRLFHPRKPVKRRVSRRGRRPKQIEDETADAEDEGSPGWGAAVLATVIGYFCYVGLTM